MNLPYSTQRAQDWRQKCIASSAPSFRFSLLRVEDSGLLEYYAVLTGEKHLTIL